MEGRKSASKISTTDCLLLLGREDGGITVGTLWMRLRVMVLENRDISRPPGAERVGDSHSETKGHTPQKDTTGQHPPNLVD